MNLKICCPACRKPISVAIPFAEECKFCNRKFQTIEGIPSFLIGKIDDNLRQSYEGDALSGDNSARTVGYISEKHYKNMIRAFQLLMQPFPIRNNILDVGCGHGVFSKGWAIQNRVIGVDIAINMLKLAKLNGLEAYHADARALPFDDNQFDFVVCAEVIQHFNDASLLLSEMARVVKQKGSVIVSTINANSIIRKSYRKLEKYFPKRFSSPYKPVLRTLDRFLVNANTLPLTVKKIALTYSPLSVVRLFNSPNKGHLFLSSNFVVQFEKEIPK